MKKSKSRRKNTGIPYELVVQSIFQEILSQEAAQTVSVEHNVTVEGRTTTHQLDVTWSFTFGGIGYTTIVQAKDWATKIKKSDVLAFRGVLDDLPGQPRGLMVTRTGFQSGARALALAYGIQPYLLRRAPLFNLALTLGSWARLQFNRARSEFNITVYRPTYRTLCIPPQSLTNGMYKPNEVFLSSADGKMLGTL